MATQTKYATANSASDNWTYPAGAYTEDDENKATCLLDTQDENEVVWYGGFQFDIPPGSAINSVEIQIRFNTELAEDSLIGMRAWLSGTGGQGSSYTNNTEPTSKTNVSHSDTGTWSLDDLNDENFEVRLYCKTTKADPFMNYNLYYIRVEVDYTAPTLGTVDFTGDGILTAIGTAFYRGVVNFTGDGTLSAIGLVVHKGVVEFAGDGTLTAKGTGYPIYSVLSVIAFPIEFEVTEYKINLEVKGLPTSGATINLRGTFPSAAGDLETLTDVEVKVYDTGGVLLETIDGADVTEVSTGIYQVEYDVPANQKGIMTYEFSGKLGTKTILSRSIFDVVWRG